MSGPVCFVPGEVAAGCCEDFACSLMLGCLVLSIISLCESDIAGEKSEESIYGSSYEVEENLILHMERWFPAEAIVAMPGSSREQLQ